MVFFSALHELQKQEQASSALQQKLRDEPQSAAAAQKGEGEQNAVEEDSSRPSATKEEEMIGDGTDVLDSDSLLSLFQEKREVCLKENSAKGEGDFFVVGMVGYPNVGKSSVINSLFGSKKVSISRQPGKTKHFQTLQLPSLHLTLCDCPG